MSNWPCLFRPCDSLCLCLCLLVAKISYQYSEHGGQLFLTPLALNTLNALFRTLHLFHLWFRMWFRLWFYVLFYLLADWLGVCYCGVWRDRALIGLGC
ncbi:hypothetical protein BpHYR1_047391 [Brachionus plicatilis]|uniref:Uncharacterized protein n=1 Tax=Brachionus plicatilis TaxID=10195 RepID=A0A3M7T5X1_BRAPC|nr:hypothetical protein BpHYR1_047391 [Brachionus plicatilis]